METIKGRILGKSISEGESANGDPWTRASFEIDEKRYSTFDIKVIESFNPGDYVELEFDKSKDGKYNNVKNMKKITAPIEEEVKIVTADKVHQVDWEKKDLKITRMASLNTTIAFLQLLSNANPELLKELLSEREPLEAVKDVAEMLIAWVYR